jgi:hypothetical protein
MQQVGFGQIWRDIISGLLMSSSTRVLVNGMPRCFIQHWGGLRQGDPLSPMPFILAMDVLGFLITKAESEGLLQPLSTRVLQHRVSYTDDVVLFLRPTSEDISITMGILQVFGETLGVRNNAQKSNVFLIWCGEQERELLQQLLPYADFPCRYLGLPLSL